MRMENWPEVQISQGTEKLHVLLTNRTGEGHCTFAQGCSGASVEGCRLKGEQGLQNKCLPAALPTAFD